MLAVGRSSGFTPTCRRWCLWATFIFTAYVSWVGPSLHPLLDLQAISATVLKGLLAQALSLSLSNCGHICFYGHCQLWMGLPDIRLLLVTKLMASFSVSLAYQYMRTVSVVPGPLPHSSSRQSVNLISDGRPCDYPLYQQTGFLTPGDF